MSGMDFMSEVSSGMVRLEEGTMLPLEIIKARIREYCDAHPLAHYSDAVIDTYDKFSPSKASGR
jgi:hypothetical protein